MPKTTSAWSSTWPTQLGRYWAWLCRDGAWTLSVVRVVKAATKQYEAVFLGDSGRGLLQPKDVQDARFCPLDPPPPPPPLPRAKTPRG